MVERVTLRSQACRGLALILLDPVEERTLALGQELLDRQLVLRILRVQLAQFSNEVGDYSTIRIRELTMTEERSARVNILY